MKELYKKYRPRSLDEIVGQPQAVKVLRRYLETKSVPHALLFTGPSGTGKTTLARILTKRLHCDLIDYTEINAALSRGIDVVRELRRSVHARPMSGRCRVYFFEEAHQLTEEAQSGLLTMVENVSRYVYFLMATTDPDKLLATLRSRYTTLRLNRLSTEDMGKLLDAVSTKQQLKLPYQVKHRIIQIADGNARTALVHLDTLKGLTHEEEQMDVLAVS
jgi:DNA polymerase-3 subunit gamma/tau